MLDLRTQGGHHADRIFPWHFHQHREARPPFYQGGQVRILCRGDQIPFPMTGNRPIFHVIGTVTDRDPIHDLSTRLARRAGGLRSPHPEPGSEMAHRFFLEHPSGLE
jgi:hypothetical protein